MEKPPGDGGTINGGFFVLSPRVIDRIAGDDTVWEQEPLDRPGARRRADGLSTIAASGSPWTRCATASMLERLWASGRAPWKVW